MVEMLHGIKAATTAGAQAALGRRSTFLEEQKVSPWGDMPVWVPGSGETAGFGKRSNRRAVDAGLTYRPLAQTALDTLDWWRALPADRRQQLRAGIAAEREKEVLAAWAAKSGKAG